MPKPRKQKESKKLVKPRIDRIVEPIISPGAPDFIKEGRVLTSGTPGTQLMLVGRGFGKAPREVVVNFGTKTVEVYPKPLFTETQVFASVPILTRGSVPVSVTVAGVKSNEVSFQIKPAPALPKPPGRLTKIALTTFDAFAVLVASEMQLADFGTVASEEYKEQIIRNILEARRGILVAVDKLENLNAMGDRLIDVLEIKDQQAQIVLRRIANNVAANLLVTFDEITAASRIVSQLEMEMARLRFGGKSNFTAGLEVVAEIAAGAGNFFDSLESAAGSLQASGELGASLVAEIGGDVTVGLDAIPALLKIVAEGISSLVKIGATISGQGDTNTQENDEKIFRESVITKVDMLEAKVDKQGTSIESVGGQLIKIEEKADRQGSMITRIDEKINKLEEKADKQGSTITIIDEQIRKVEAKSDKFEGKMDKTDVKLQLIEEKLDKNEIKNDRIQEKLDKLEPKLDKLEGKADKAEGKLDKLEGKADKAEGKLDKLEGKADRAEGKLDKLEGKADKSEGKLDKLEPKIDKLEGKADRAEGKLDKLEPKLDRLQVAADRSKEFWQFESANWNVQQASKVGVKVQSPLLLPGPTTLAFSVESIQIPKAGLKVVKLIVDDVPTDVSGFNIVTPSNVVVDIGIGLIGASRSVEIEFDKPYDGPVEFNGEKPQGLRLCTVVGGAGSSQVSPNPC